MVQKGPFFEIRLRKIGKKSCLQSFSSQNWKIKKNVRGYLVRSFFSIYFPSVIFSSLPWAHEIVLKLTFLERASPTPFQSKHNLSPFQSNPTDVIMRWNIKLWFRVVHFCCCLLTSLIAFCLAINSHNCEIPK